jgi:hypothetical protein
VSDNQLLMNDSASQTYMVDLSGAHPASHATGTGGIFPRG